MGANNSQGVSTIRVLAAIMIGMVLEGLDLQLLAVSLPSIMKDFKLSGVAAGILGSLSLGGMFFGGILGGWLADRLGRVKIILYSYILFSIFTAGIGLASEFWHIATLRLLSGFFIAAAFTPAIALAAEVVSTKWRGTIVGFIESGWSYGYCFAGLMAVFIMSAYSWRPMFFATLVPGIIAALMLIGVKDSESYLASREKARKAGKRKNEFGLIFRDKTVRLNVIMWFIASSCMQFGYYGVNNWLPSYLVKDLGVNLKSMGWFIAATYIVMAIGKTASGYFSDLIGRRPVWAIIGVGSAIALPALVYFATPANVIYLLLFAGLFFGSCWGVYGSYMSESFPTQVRGTAMGTAQNFGKIGALTSPIAIGYFATQYSISFGIAAMGLAYFIGGVILPIFVKEKMYDCSGVDATAVTEVEKDDRTAKATS